MAQQVAGFRFSGCAAGIKKRGGLDLGLIVADEPVMAAGVYTRNLVRAAPVELTMARVAAGGRVQAVLVNSGNANACTGAAGMEAALVSTRAVAQALGVDEGLVVPASTGENGALMPAETLVAAVRELVAGLRAEVVEALAEASCTTDRRHKVATGSVRCVDGSLANLVGVAKGA